jgi:hypothetical protein
VWVSRRGGFGLVRPVSDDGGQRLDMMFGLSRKDWPFLVMARTALFDSVTTERAVLGNCLTEGTDGHIQDSSEVGGEQNA